MKIKKAVVLLAGLGTRCLPFTVSLPKAFLPILNKPSIQVVVEEIVASGIKEIIFVLPKGRQGKLILRHFKKNKRQLKFLKKRNKLEEINLINGYQNLAKIKGVFAKPNGSGGALFKTQKLLKKEEAFALLNGDDLFFGKALSELIKVFEKTNCNVLGLGRVKDEQRQNYGIVEGVEEGDLLKINRLIEKPKQNQTKSNLALLGRYIFKREIFERLKQLPKANGEILLTDVIVKMIDKNKNVVGTKILCPRFDGGNKLGLLKANIYFGLKDKGICEELKEFLIEQ